MKTGLPANYHTGGKLKAIALDGEKLKAVEANIMVPSLDPKDSNLTFLMSVLLDDKKIYRVADTLTKAPSPFERGEPANEIVYFVFHCDPAYFRNPKNYDEIRNSFFLKRFCHAEKRESGGVYVPEEKYMIFNNAIVLACVLDHVIKDAYLIDIDITPAEFVDIFLQKSKKGNPYAFNKKETIGILTTADKIKSAFRKEMGDFDIELN